MFAEGHSKTRTRKKEAFDKNMTIGQVV